MGGGVLEAAGRRQRRSFCSLNGRRVHARATPLPPPPRWVFSQLHKKGLVYRGFQVGALGGGEGGVPSGPEQGSLGDLPAAACAAGAERHTHTKHTTHKTHARTHAHAGDALLHRVLHAAGQL